MAQGSGLSQLIRRRREDLLASWEAGIRTLASAARIPQPALMDQASSFLDWLADRLDGAEGTDTARDAWSQRHASERLLHGYDLVEIVAEWALLRDGLLEAWEAEPDGVTAAEVRRMNAEIDHVIALCAVEYARGLRAAGPRPSVPPGGP